jgi:hypothetical protein
MEFSPVVTRQLETSSGTTLIDYPGDERLFLWQQRYVPGHPTPGKNIDKYIHNMTNAYQFLQKELKDFI